MDDYIICVGAMVADKEKHKMLLTTFDIFDPVRILDRANRNRGLFDNLDLYYDTRTSRSNYSVETTDDGLNLSIELPGVSDSDLSVLTSDNQVNISGILRGKKFSYVYVVPKDYDLTSCEATLSKGVLTLQFIRTEGSHSRTIPIKVN